MHGVCCMCAAASYRPKTLPALSPHLQAEARPGRWAEGIGATRRPPCGASSGRSVLVVAPPVSIMQSLRVGVLELGIATPSRHQPLLGHATATESHSEATSVVFGISVGAFHTHPSVRPRYSSPTGAAPLRSFHSQLPRRRFPCVARSPAHVAGVAGRPSCKDVMSLLTMQSGVGSRSPDCRRGAWAHVLLGQGGFGPRQRHHVLSYSKPFLAATLVLPLATAPQGRMSCESRPRYARFLRTVG